ncbi:MAG: MFS transporter [Chloroflexi bacterium]|nr:MFS transporter [Chloroflexota bacterium]
MRGSGAAPGTPDSLVRSKAFAYITVADFLVRSAYQMGKTPLLPIFAAALGAEAALLGFIVSVSTLTGMVLKPFIGVLSDRWGRRGWLILGTVFFALMPFLYRFVETPDQLFALRIVHGLATAIYGPVTLAYVAELSRQRRAERMAWFGLARNGGYIVGPAVAGWMLLSMDPVSVFTIIGLVSSLAFLPILLLPESRGRATRQHGPLLPEAVRALVSGGKTPAVWLAGGLEGTMYVVLYATKAFLPLFALSVGFNVAVAGTFFAVQEAAHLALNPIGGRLGDRFGYLTTVPAGMVVLAAALPLLTLVEGVAYLMGVAVLMGAAQALVFPSTLALVSNSVGDRNLATGLGLLGTLKNGGKVAGPAIGGLMVHWLDYDLTFQLMAAALLASAIVVRLRPGLIRRSRRGPVPA